MACLRPTARPSATPGVEQNAPMLTPGVANVADSEAIARSQVATSWQPAAVARPCTLAITGCGRRAIVHHPAAAREQRLDLLDASHGANLLEVMAGAESAAAGGEHHHADARIGGDAVQGRLQLADQGARQRVELSRAIERHGGDAIRDVDEERRLGLVCRADIGPLSSSRS